MEYWSYPLLTPATKALTLVDKLTGCGILETSSMLGPWEGRVLPRRAATTSSLE